MKTSKLTIATMFLASLAWAGVAKADEPCGAPVELLNSCEVLQEPECYDACEPDAMLISCMSDGAAACVAKCGDAKALNCEASCANDCSAQCADGLIPQKPLQCEVSCGADCMGGCSASCLGSGDKTLCFAACGQQCSAHCTASCAGGGGGYAQGGYEGPEQGQGGKGPAQGGGGYEGPGQGQGQGGGGYDAGLLCQASCEQSCAGSCQAEVARDCEIGCQADSASSCKAGLTNKCHQVCRGGGVLQCDQQFLDIDDIDACIAELERHNVPVVGAVDVLRPEAKQIVDNPQASCSVEDQAKLGLAGALFTLLSFGLGTSLLRRRRK